MKICKKCLRELSLDDFYNGFSSCKKCVLEKQKELYKDKEYALKRAEMSRRWRIQNKEKYQDYNRKRDIKRKGLNRKIIDELKIKLGGKCSFCGFKDKRALVFHHTDGIPDFRITSCPCSRNRKELEEELLKCVLICANCHAIIHSTENVKGAV